MTARHSLRRPTFFYQPSAFSLSNSTAALNCHRIILLIRNYELLIRNYELLIRIYELVIRNYEIVIRNYGLVIRNYELRNRPHCQVQGDYIIVQSICAPNHLN